MDDFVAASRAGTRPAVVSPPKSEPSARQCPIDLGTLTPVTSTSAEDVVGVVERARAAQRQWAEAPLAERIGALRTAAKRLLARRHEAIELVRAELGKVDVEAIFNEALGPLDAVNGWARVVSKAAPRKPVRLNPVSFAGKSASVELVPRGVVGVIAPWNFPIAGLYRSVIPALMTGNAVVVKPSPHSPESSAWLCEVLSSVLPAGLVAVVHGDGPVAEALIDAGIDACVFTGSPETGRKVRVRCADRAIPASIEMGGKDPAIVLADCDRRRTVAGITSWALANAGQACGAIEIAYVDRAIADAFVNELASAWRRLRAGPGAHGEVDVAPLANHRQLELVAKHVHDAVARGAKIVCGGEPTGQGLWFAPTILDHCTDDMLVVRDETFGPVLAIVRIDGAAEAIAAANRSRYGLGASIWTRDIDRAKRLAARIDAGVVTINNHAFSGAIPELPWSGTRETGFGIANGPHSLLTFVRPKATVVDRSNALELYWLPYDRAVWELGDILCDVQRGAMGRAWKLPLLLRERVRHLRTFFGRDGGARA